MRSALPAVVVLVASILDAQTRYRFDSAEPMPQESSMGGPIWNYGAAAGVNRADSTGPEIWRWTHDLGFERFTCELPGADGCSVRGVAPAPDGSVVVIGYANWPNHGRLAESFIARFQSGGQPPRVARLGSAHPYTLAVGADNSIWLIGIGRPLRPGRANADQMNTYGLWRLRPDFTELGGTETLELKGWPKAFVAQAGHLWLVTSSEDWVLDLSETGSIQKSYKLPNQNSGRLAISKGGDIVCGSWLLDTATQKWRPHGVEGFVIGYDGDRLVTVAYGHILFHEPVR